MAGFRLTSSCTEMKEIPIPCGVLHVVSSDTEDFLRS